MLELCVRSTEGLALREAGGLKGRTVGGWGYQSPAFPPPLPKAGSSCLAGSSAERSGNCFFVSSSDQFLGFLMKDDFSVTSSLWVEKMVRFARRRAFLPGSGFPSTCMVQVKGNDGEGGRSGERGRGRSVWGFSSRIQGFLSR